MSSELDRAAAGLVSAPLVLDSQHCVTQAPTRRCPQARKVWIPTEFCFATVPCKRWDCSVCGPRKSRELARVLAIDALGDHPPTHAITLTTAQPWEELDPAVYRQASKAVWKRLRRRYGRVEYFGFIEFTTGRAARSGGFRRLHGHYLVKFLDCDPDVIEVERLVRETWEAVTGAYIVEVAQLLTPSAAINYLSLHHQKPQQAPPRSWRGQRSRPSNGYFEGPMWKLRERAVEELRFEAIAWKRGCTVEEVQLRELLDALEVDE